MTSLVERRSRHAKLDTFDLRILEVLQRDGRISNQRLADEIALSPSACYERVKRLERAGYISSYRAKVQFDKIATTCTNIVTVSLNTHRSQDFRRFETVVRNIPEIVSCYEVGGGVDYVLTVVTISIQHYQDIIDRILESEAGVERYTTCIVLREVKENAGLPIRHLLDVEAERH
ncbi:Lrp/AsnC family transcriptional regulator [Mesorhizobium sp.]|uniref:Lrp/AsnC family transcriptional regulator n=1 Tax=Mesorhizobium sp. TaxID=1871066 RepID=UPI0025BEB267|nr:Lrp/AsnC family transcriptional regulator [Mesorhizobium sp.]